MDIHQLFAFTDPFKRLSLRQRTSIASFFEEKTFPAGSAIVEQGQPVAFFGILLAGSAKIIFNDPNGTTVPCGYLKSGDLIFDMAILIGTAAWSTLIATTQTTCAVQERELFIETLESYPALKAFFYKKTTDTILGCHHLSSDQAPYHRKCNSDFDSCPIFLRKALIYINRNYHRPITLEMVANESAMSKYHFSRLFKRHMGLSFKQYLNTKRIRAAKALLLQGRCSVTEAGFAVGFNDASYFARVFQRIEGCSPRDFRRYSLNHAAAECVHREPSMCVPQH